MNLFVGNLSPDTTEAELRSVFSEFGEVVTAKVVRDAITGMSRLFGFVEIAEKHAAMTAIDNLDSSYLQGNIISVKEAKQNNPRSGSNNFSSENRTFKPRPPRDEPRPPRDENFNRF